MITWRGLLSTPIDESNAGLDGTEFGPNTPQVAAAVSALRAAAWFESVGQPIPKDCAALQVESWDDVYPIFDEDSERYTVGGHLLAVVERYEDFLDTHGQEEAWWQRAVDFALGTIPIPLPKNQPQDRRELLFDYCQLYIPKLLGEIIVGEAIRCTYFREQLQWFYAGHLPCGWEGDWPEGRMRVY
jgi:hypothetical protein